MPDNVRKLRVFLCHASQDKPIVRELYQRLHTESWINPWLDEEKLLPGQEWDAEIETEVNLTDVVIICFSSNSITKDGYVQKEIRKVLDKAEEKPEQTIFIVPLRLDDSEIPARLKKWHYINYFPPEARNSAYERLLQSLRIRVEQVGNNDELIRQDEKRGTSFLPEILLIGLLVGLFASLAAWVFTLGICPPLGAFPGGLIASYWFLVRRKDIPREDGLKFGKFLGMITGIPAIVVYVFQVVGNANILQAARNPYAAENIYVYAIGILFLICASIPMSVGLGWLGGWLGSHYYASKWK